MAYCRGSLRQTENIDEEREREREREREEGKRERKEEKLRRIKTKRF